MGQRQIEEASKMKNSHGKKTNRDLRTVYLHMLHNKIVYPVKPVSQIQYLDVDQYASVLTAISHSGIEHASVRASLEFRALAQQARLAREHGYAVGFLIVDRP